MAHHPDGFSAADRREREHSVGAGAADNRQLHDPSPAGGRPGEDERENMGCELPERQQRTVPGAAEGSESRNRLDSGQREAERGEAGTGVEQNDRAGKAVAERIRAATAGLLAKAGRMGERLRGMAEDVWAYATGERDAERARIGLEQAGAEFERAAAPLVRELNAIQQNKAQEKLHMKDMTAERQSKKTYGGPTLG